MKDREFRGLLVDNVEKCKIILTGIPYDGNASIGKGAAEAPARIRELSRFFPPLTMDGEDISACKIFDRGDLVCEDEDCPTYFRRIEEQVSSTLRNDKLNLFIGGDHSVAIPLEKAFLDFAKKQGKKAGIIHIDAHPDICDVYEESRLSHACPIRRAIDNGFDKTKLLLIGMRGYELQETEYFKQNAEIEVYPSSYIIANGIKPILKRIEEKFDEEDLIYLSYDIDVNDPCFAPGTGTPEPFGLNSLDVLNMIRHVFRKRKVIAMDMVEIAPPLDSNDLTTWLGLKTLYEIFKILIDRGNER